MIGFDAQTLALAMKGCPMDRAQVWAPRLEAAMAAYDINSPERAAAFIAQIGHETNGLLWITELGGESYFAKYNGRKDLGNMQPGDGPRFRGRGCIQVTGRANYGAATKALRAKFGPDVPDFVAEPLKMADPEWAALSAGDYWFRKGLSILADKGEFARITAVINGGQNGAADRVERHERARKALGLA